MSASTKSDKATRLTPVESYQYDAGGRRIATIRGTNTVRHLYEGMHVVADTDAAGNLLRSYTWGPGIDNLLSITVYPISTNSTASTFNALTDHLGTVHALVTPGGTVVERYEYDAWGNVMGVFDGNGNPLTSDLGLPTSALGNRYLFQGREYSWAVHEAWGGAGLYYFRARYYDPQTGRWLSNDPIGISGGLNQYAFCANNPVMFVDPLGLQGKVYNFHEPGSEDYVNAEDFKPGKNIVFTGHGSPDGTMRRWVSDGEGGGAFLPVTPKEIADIVAKHNDPSAIVYLVFCWSATEGENSGAAEVSCYVSNEVHGYTKEVGLQPYTYEIPYPGGIATTRSIRIQRGVGSKEVKFKAGMISK